MPTQHPYYDYLSVYYGEHGEKARAGAFYVPRYGDNLSKIARSAYGLLSSTLSGVQRINKSLWNIEAAEANAFNYRRNSTSCNAKIVDPRLALTTSGYNDGGWLALCPPYPLFWIPSSDGEMPEDLRPATDPKKAFLTPIPKGDRTVSKKRTSGPKTTTVQFGPSANSPYTQEPAKKGAIAKRTPVATAGFSPWLLLALLAAAGGAYWWWKKKRKK